VEARKMTAKKRRTEDLLARSRARAAERTAFLQGVLDAGPDADLGDLTPDDLYRLAWSVADDGDRDTLENGLQPSLGLPTDYRGRKAEADKRGRLVAFLHARGVG
jgi:hypothetical protein